MSVRFEQVNPQTREITVHTDDGDVPLESLSQGTISLISWVGVLLQRLYEVSRADETPRERYALVLIDELDAHMHPTWQTSIVGELSRTFTKVQFIATTHSPLVVRGMAANQVVRFKRDANGHVERVEVPDDMTMGRADQVLAGALFDVDPTLDELTEGEIARYKTLLGKEQRKPEEEEEFRQLQKTLEYRIPAPETSPTDRRARELLEALLVEQVGPKFPEVKEQLLARAQALFDELQRRAKEAS
jgi:predicted ATP-binding protein involved in virulence